MKLIFWSKNLFHVPCMTRKEGDQPSIELKGCEKIKSVETLPERNDPKLELLPGRGLK